jgi:fumarate reductase subunit C
MDPGAHYTLYHPKWYRQPVSVWWWLESWPYTKFVLRELSSLAVGYFALLALAQARAIRRGPEAYARFSARLSSPLFVALDALALCFVLFHSFTWFNLAPKAMVVRVGGRRVRDSVVIGANYLAWAAISITLAWILLRGGG